MREKEPIELLCLLIGEFSEIARLEFFRELWRNHVRSYNSEQDFPKRGKASAMVIIN